MAFGRGLAIWNTSLQRRVPKLLLEEWILQALAASGLGRDFSAEMKGSCGARECAPLEVAVSRRLVRRPASVPEATLSVRRREALGEAIDLVHDRYWSDLE
jgi:hypothetical protein